MSCRELQCVVVNSQQSAHSSVSLLCVAVGCSELQSVAVCCSQFSTVNTFLSFITQCTIKNIQLPTVWRRGIECLKLRVSFRKRATIYRDFLQKTTYKTSYESSPPCTSRYGTVVIWCVCVCVGGCSYKKSSNCCE